ncbi:MAG: LuxR C-terminal-related transcriptional regulator [Dehalococcoidia bacterium]
MARIRPSDLSETQRKILTFLSAGRSNPQIAGELGIARETVKWNVSQLLSLLALDNRQELAEWYRHQHRAPTKTRTRGDEMTGPMFSKTGGETFSAAGETLAVQEWRGSAPGELHVHHSADIAWHIIEGSLSFRFADSVRSLSAGETVFIPAGTAHTYGEGMDSRYLVIAPPRLFELFEALRTARSRRPFTDWGNGPDREIYRRYDSELLE